MDHPSFRFMAWAKEQVHGEGHRLVASGMPPFPAGLLGKGWFELELAEVDPYGPSAVAEKTAARYGLSREEVFLCGGGSSLALNLVCRLLLEPGDLVLVESPGYEALLRVPELHGARVAPLPRRAAEGYRPDCDALSAGLARGARLVLLSNLHNPTGTLLEESDLLEIAEACARAGARLVVDEVFLEFLPLVKRPRAVHALHPAAVTVASFTKAFGMGSLRTGWVLAEPNLAKRLEGLNDLFQVTNPTLPFEVLKRILQREDAVRAWLAMEMTRIRRARRVLEESPLFSFPEPAGGVTLFGAVPGVADTEALCRFLAKKRGVYVVPGSFFDDPGRIRLGLALPEEKLEAALQAFLDGVEAWSDEPGKRGTRDNVPR